MGGVETGRGILQPLNRLRMTEVDVCDREMQAVRGLQREGAVVGRPSRFAGWSDAGREAWVVTADRGGRIFEYVAGC